MKNSNSLENRILELERNTSPSTETSANTSTSESSKSNIQSTLQNNSQINSTGQNNAAQQNSSTNTINLTAKQEAADLNNAAVEAYNRGDYKTARSLLSQAQLKDPTNSDVNNNLSKIQESDAHAQRMLNDINQQTQESKQKMEENATQFATQLGQLTPQLTDAIDNLDKKSDPKGIFNWKHIGFLYDYGFNDKFENFSFDLGVNLFIFSAGMKVGYSQNSMLGYNVLYNNDLPTNKDVYFSTSGVSLEFLIGLNIPIGKYFAIWPMYGINPLSPNVSGIELVENDDFRLVDDLDIASVDGFGSQNRYALNFLINIPKTGLGIKLFLSYLTQSSSYSLELKEVPLKYRGSTSDYPDAWRYYVGKATSENYSTYTAGFSIIFGLSR